jgi:2'-5' RNA ligase
MRLYAAVVPPQSQVERLFEDLSAHSDDGALTWTAVEAVRIGLCYFGSLTQTDAARLTARVTVKAAELDSFPLRFSGGGALDEEGDDSVWVGLRGDLDQLSALASAMADTARVDGLMVDRRAYRPRFPVARITANTTVPRLQTIVDTLTAYEGDAWNVTELALIEPRLSSEHTAFQSFDVVAVLPLAARPVASETGDGDEPSPRSDTGDTHVPRPAVEHRRT